MSWEDSCFNGFQPFLSPRHMKLVLAGLEKLESSELSGRDKEELPKIRDLFKSEVEIKYSKER
jgi:hypothetical protein